MEKQESGWAQAICCEWYDVSGGNGGGAVDPRIVSQSARILKKQRPGSSESGWGPSETRLRQGQS